MFRETGSVLIAAVLLGQPADGPVVARVGNRVIYITEIRCPVDACLDSDQERLTRRIVELVAERALRNAGIDANGAELRAAVQRHRLSENSMHQLTATHRRIARAAVQAYEDGNVQRAYDEHLRDHGIPRSMLEEFMRVAGDAESAKSFLDSDLEEQISNDLERRTAAAWRVQRLREYLAEWARSDTGSAEKFWLDVLGSSDVEVASGFVVPDLKGVLESHENHVRPLH